MTLGCGGYGGNITSDNISPRHLLNIKRLAYEITPATNRFESAGASVRTELAPPLAAAAARPSTYSLPAAPQRPAPPAGISAEALSRRIDDFLGSRGYRAEAAGATTPTLAPRRTASDQSPLDFVCEEDVRLAIQAGRTLVVSERAIVTPAARDLGEQHRIFTVAPWRG